MFKRSGKMCVLIAMAVFLMSSCAAPLVSAPTPDLNLVRTEAVVTAVAQMTKQAAINTIPSQAPVIPTTEPFVTSTPFVATATTSIFDGGGMSSSGGSSSSGTGSGSSGATVPTWTPVIYRAVFVTQNYLDGYNCPTGEQLDFKVTFQNVGLATWDTTHYYLKRMYNSPDIKLTNSDQYPIKADVPSGAKGTFVIDIACPTYPGGPWTTQWGLVNDNGDIFAKFYFRFFTGLHATPTPVKTRTPSPG
jgi:hypothetical protein